MLQDHELNRTLTQISYQKYLKVRWKPPEERQPNPISPQDQTKENQKPNRTSGYKNVNNMGKTFLKSTTGLDLELEIGGKDDFSIARRNR